MQQEEQKEIEKYYIELYRCMVEKDLTSLSNILTDGFVLVHMTGMEQDKQAFIQEYFTEISQIILHSRKFV